MSGLSVFAANVPDEVVTYIKRTVPESYIRFDGVVILPDNTVYLPLFPSLFSDITNLKIKSSIPAGMGLEQEPDVVIFNNDFVLLKVINTTDGHKTILPMAQPPLQVRTGLLPQDMLVPSGLVIPENLKGIVGNLKIDTNNADVIKQTSKESFEEFLTENEIAKNQEVLPQFKNKIMFVTTNYSKNIQIVEPAKALPLYSLAQKSIPVNIECVDNGRFLLVTSYERPFLDIISVADSRFIKQINLETCPEEIVIDEINNKAYVTAPKDSLIFVIDLKTMSVIQKIRVNGYCEKLLLADGKMFYADKMKDNIWSIEPDNQYLLKNVGKFPNVSAMAYSDGNLYIASRTKSRVAVVNYNDLSLTREFTTSNKPVAMFLYCNILYILGAQNNMLTMLDATTGNVINTTELNTGGFSTRINQIEQTDLGLITDIKSNMYTIFNLNTGKILKTYKLNIPIKDIKITNKVRLFE
ncbi:MAG: hypothetical protein MJ237_02880 [bacterium]|nr:hypothetical protein [bacterium]